MLQARVQVMNKTGLHARPASKLVQEANKYKSEIIIKYKNEEANAKSILGVMALGATKGSELLVKAKGEDEEEALNGIIGLIKDGLGEEV